MWVFFYIEDKQYELNLLYVYIAEFDFSGVCSLCLVYKGCELIVLIIKLFKTSSKYVLIYDRGRLEIESINKRCKYKQSGDSKHLDSALPIEHHLVIPLIILILEEKTVATCLLPP